MVDVVVVVLVVDPGAGAEVVAAGRVVVDEATAVEVGGEVVEVGRVFEVEGGAGVDVVVDAGVEVVVP